MTAFGCVPRASVCPCARCVEAKTSPSSIAPQTPTATASWPIATCRKPGSSPARNRSSTFSSKRLMSSISRRNSRSRSSDTTRRFSTLATRFECTFCRVTLVEQWPALENGLPAGWGSARLELTVTKGDAEKAAALLGPAQPLRVAPGVFRLTTARDGTALNPTAVKRLVAHLDEQGIGGALELVSSEAAPVTPPRAAEKTLAQSWDDA